MTTTDLTDIGPAPQPPSWCLPATDPNTDSNGDGHLWSWSREFGQDVWIECEDRIVDGRMLRSAPQIVYADAIAKGVTCAQARELAAALVAAADAITEAALDEASR